MKTTTLNACIATGILLLTGAAIAQDEDQPLLYVSVDCMKSTAPDYPILETEIWQPMHQELVNKGQINSWALYWVRFGDRSRCDYYTVTSYLGEAQLNAGPSFDEAFAAVHKGKNFEKTMGMTWAARQHVASELLVLIDSTAINEHRYAIVNKMYAKDPDAYESMERRVFKPGHQALVDDGYRSGWGLYELVSPVGTAVPYNFGTVDFVDHLSPVPMAEAMLQAHPNRDLEAIHEMLQLREHISSETWLLIAATTNSEDE